MIARSSFSLACCVFLIEAGAWGCDPDPSEDAFAVAAYVPADVTAYINVAEGARLRRELAVSPMGDWLTNWTISPQLAGAWSALAESAHMSCTDLFDQAFGEGFTLVVRERGSSTEWAIVSYVEHESAHALFQKLQPRLVDRWEGMLVFDLPEHQLLLTRTEEALLIGPRGKERRLLETMCRAIADEIENPLAEEPAFERAMELGSGPVFAFVRHETAESREAKREAKSFKFASNQSAAARAELEEKLQRRVAERDWSAVVGQLDGRTLTLRHASSKPILAVADLAAVGEWNMAPLRAIGERNTIAVIKSVNQDASIFEIVVDERLGSTGWRLAIEELQGRRIIVMDDPSTPAISVTAPMVVARAFELSDNEAHTQELIAQLQAANERTQSLSCGSYLIRTSYGRDLWAAAGELPDNVQQGDVAVFQGLPVMEPQPVQWTVASGPDANWCVMSNDAEKLIALAEALEADDGECEPEYGAWLSCGAGDGRRLSEMLAKLAESQTATAKHIRTLTTNQGVAHLASLASVVERFNWSLARWEDDLLALEVELELASEPEAVTDVTEPIEPEEAPE